MEQELVKEEEQLTLCGKFFHKMGMFLMKRALGQQVGLFVRAIASIFSESPALVPVLLPTKRESAPHDKTAPSIATATTHSFTRRILSFFT